MRRRVAVLALGLAGLIGVALIVVRLLRPAAPELPAQQHRVELDLPPVEAALWFATRYPEYFDSGEDGLQPWLDGLDPREREFVLAMSQTLTWTWVEHELAGMTGDGPEALAREAIAVVRAKTVNQLEVNIEHFGALEGRELVAYIGDPKFAGGVFARLVRGGSNCEGQNHLLALLLDTALGPSARWQPRLLRAEMVGVPDGHELVRVAGPGLAQPMFADAWSNLPPFVVGPADGRADGGADGGADGADGDDELPPTLAELGVAPAPVVPGRPGRVPYSAADYRSGDGVYIELVPRRDAPTMPVDLELRAPSLDAASLAQIDDPWRLFVYARILHVYDDPRAGALYRLVLERHCNYTTRPRSYVCAATREFVGRVGAG